MFGRKESKTEDKKNAATGYRCYGKQRRNRKMHEDVDRDVWSVGIRNGRIK